MAIGSSVRLTKVVKEGGEDQTLVHCKCRNRRSAARGMGGDRRESSLSYWIKGGWSGDEICSGVSVTVGRVSRWKRGGEIVVERTIAGWIVDHGPVE